MTQPLKVINLFGAPGVGKSTAACGLFNIMKTRGYSVEYVPEYAKDLTWAKDFKTLEHQPSVLAQQDLRLHRLHGQVEWVVTDSPIPIQIAYFGDYWLRTGLEGVAWNLYRRYDNYNVLLQRNLKLGYEAAGRNQDLKQAMVLDNVIDNLFDTATRDYAGLDYGLELMTARNNPQQIFEWITSKEDYAELGTE